MRRVAWISTVLIGLLLGACTVRSMTPEEPAKTSRYDDQFKPYVEIVGEPYRTGALPYNLMSTRLRGRRDRATGDKSILAEVQFEYHGKLTIKVEQARNARAVPLVVRTLYHEGGGCRKESGCPHVSVFNVEIPLADLEAARTSGYAFKLFAQAGAEHVVHVNAVSIDSMLKALDAWQPAPAPVAKAR